MIAHVERTARIDADLRRADELMGSTPPKVAEVIDVLQRALHVAPRDPRPSLRLSEVLRRTTPNHDDGNEARNAAIAFAVRGTWLAPDDAGAHLVLAKAFHRQHWFQLAIQHLERSWELDPSAETAFWMGWMLSEVGHLDEDLVWLGRARDMDPTLPGLAAEFGYAYRVLELHSEAESSLRTAVNEDPSDGYPLGNLLLLLAAQDRYADLAAHGEALASNGAASNEILAESGLAFWLAGEPERAAPVLERVISVDPSQIVGTWGTHAADLLAEVRWREGKREEAGPLIAWSIDRYDLRLRRASEGWGFRYDRARLAALVGDLDGALGWLQDAIASGWNDSALARRDPMLTNLNGDRRFAVLLDGVDHRVRAMRERCEPQGMASDAV